MAEGRGFTNIFWEGVTLTNFIIISLKNNELVKKINHVKEKKVIFIVSPKTNQRKTAFVHIIILLESHNITTAIFTI